MRIPSGLNLPGRTRSRSRFEGIGIARCGGGPTIRKAVAALRDYSQCRHRTARRCERRFVWVEPSQKALRQRGPEAEISCRNVIQRAGDSSAVRGRSIPGARRECLGVDIRNLRSETARPQAFPVRKNESRPGVNDTTLNSSTLLGQKGRRPRRSCATLWLLRQVHAPGSTHSRKCRRASRAGRAGFAEDSSRDGGRGRVPRRGEVFNLACS